MAVTESTLADVKRRAATDHILVAARRLVIDTGLDVTMDQIADATGVSRRTLFRHFVSRERLIAAAFDAGMAGYSEQLPHYDGDLERWLRSTCETAHRMNTSFGPGFWELTSRSNLPPELVAIERRRRRGFRASVTQIAGDAWRARGHEGEPPAALGHVIGAHLSPHFTASVVDDVGEPWELAADLAYDGILSALQRYE